MAFGFEARNTDGYVVIDTVYNNLCLQQRYDFSVGAGATFSVSQGSCVAPMMCINASDYVGFYGLAVSGSVFTWRFKAAAAASGSIYIFDRPHPSHVSPFGMKIMDTDGVTEMFNSDNNYLRVAGILNVPWSAASSFLGPNVTGGVATNSSLPSAKYAVCASNARVTSSSLGNNNFRRTFDGVKTTATSVSVAQVVNIDFFAGGGGEHPGTFAVSGSGTVPAQIVNVEGL